MVMDATLQAMMVTIPMGTLDAIDFVLDKLRNTKTNAEFFESMNA